MAPKKAKGGRGRKPAVPEKATIPQVTKSNARRKAMQMVPGLKTPVTLPNTSSNSWPWPSETPRESKTRKSNTGDTGHQNQSQKQHLANTSSVKRKRSNPEPIVKPPPKKKKVDPPITEERIVEVFNIIIEKFVQTLSSIENRQRSHKRKRTHEEIPATITSASLPSGSTLGFPNVDIKNIPLNSNSNYEINSDFQYSKRIKTEKLEACSIDEMPIFSNLGEEGQDSGYMSTGYQNGRSNSTDIMFGVAPPPFEGENSEIFGGIQNSEMSSAGPIIQAFSGNGTATFRVQRNQEPLLYQCNDSWSYLPLEASMAVGEFGPDSNIAIQSEGGPAPILAHNSKSTLNEVLLPPAPTTKGSNLAQDNIEGDNGKHPENTNSKSNANVSDFLPTPEPPRQITTDYPTNSPEILSVPFQNQTNINQKYGQTFSLYSKIDCLTPIPLPAGCLLKNYKGPSISTSSSSDNQVGPPSIVTTAPAPLTHSLTSAEFYEDGPFHEFSPPCRRRLNQKSRTGTLNAETPKWKTYRHKYLTIRENAFKRRPKTPTPAHDKNSSVGPSSYSFVECPSCLRKFTDKIEGRIHFAQCVSSDKAKS